MFSFIGRKLMYVCCTEWCNVCKWLINLQVDAADAEQVKSHVSNIATSINRQEITKKQ